MARLVGADNTVAMAHVSGIENRGTVKMGRLMAGVGEHEEGKGGGEAILIALTSKEVGDLEAEALRLRHRTAAQIKTNVETTQRGGTSNQLLIRLHWGFHQGLHDTCGYKTAYCGLHQRDLTSG